MTGRLPIKQRTDRPVRISVSFFSIRALEARIPIATPLGPNNSSHLRLFFHYSNVTCEIAHGRYDRPDRSRLLKETVSSPNDGKVEGLKCWKKLGYGNLVPTGNRKSAEQRRSSKQHPESTKVPSVKNDPLHTAAVIRSHRERCDVVLSSECSAFVNNDGKSTFNTSPQNLIFCMQV